MSAAESTKSPNSAKRLQLAAFIVAGIAVGAAGAVGVWSVWLKPLRDDAQIRTETVQDTSKLFGLQLQYFQAQGAYANDLDTLLALDPDRAAFKAHMARHLDMSTIAVVGNAKKFKIEANALDKDRTLIKLKGPVFEQDTTEADIRMTEASSSAGGDAGVPLAPHPTH